MGGGRNENRGSRSTEAGRQSSHLLSGQPHLGILVFLPADAAQHGGRGVCRIKELWTPIFDVYDECGVKLALEVHPTEIAFDYYSTKKLLDTLDWRPTLGLNFDPSHLQWQGMDPCLFLRDFASRIYHVHMKDVKVKLDGRGGILGSHIEFGDSSRGWNFVSLGHGDVDFDGIIRELNQMGYDGPLSVEWEDSGMERTFGAAEAFEFQRKSIFFTLRHQLRRRPEGRISITETGVKGLCGRGAEALARSPSARPKNMRGKKGFDYGIQKRWR